MVQIKCHCGKINLKDFVGNNHLKSKILPNLFSQKEALNNIEFAIKISLKKKAKLLKREPPFGDHPASKSEH